MNSENSTPSIFFHFFISQLTRKWTKLPLSFSSLIFFIYLVHKNNINAYKYTVFILLRIVLNIRSSYRTYYFLIRQMVEVFEKKNHVK
jgi:hypothetical protein